MGMKQSRSVVDTICSWGQELWDLIFSSADLKYFLLQTSPKCGVIKSLGTKKNNFFCRHDINAVEAVYSIETV